MVGFQPTASDSTIDQLLSQRATATFEERFFHYA
jgi:hypothetical protein